MKFLRILFLIFGLAVFANAQDKEKSFILSGTIYAPKTVVAETKITAENKDGQKFQTISDEKGVYKFSIPLGEYKLSYCKDGFKLTTINFENVSLSEKTFDVNLEVGNYPCNEKINQNSLIGRITDDYGNLISKAKIRAIGKKQNFNAETDENGLYKIALPIGIYTIVFEASEHKSYKIKGYRTTSKQPMRLDVALKAKSIPIFL